MPGYFGFKYPQKLLYTDDQIRDINARVAVGCTSLKALAMYKEYLTEQFPDRPVFVVKGEVVFHKRNGIIEQVKATENGILISTQQSLKSSINIHGYYDVFLEALL